MTSGGGSGGARGGGAANLELARQLRKVKDLLADPDSLHVLKPASIRRLSLDTGTRDYIQNVLQSPVNTHTRSAAKNWRKLKVNVAIFNAVKSAHRPDSAAREGSARAALGNDMESSDDSDTDQVRGEGWAGGAAGGGAGGSSDGGAAVSFSELNVTLERRQSQVHKTVVRSEYYKDPHCVSLDDLRDILAREGVRASALSNKVAMLPGMSAASMQQVQELMSNQKFLKWDFDVFDLEAKSEGHSLWFAGMMVFLHYNFAGAFKLPLEKMSALLLHVERTYCMDPTKPNHYHTHLHAADVTLTVAHFCEVQVVTHQLQGTNALSLLLAAIMHDYRHPGVNNMYLVKRFDDLSVTYNDQSVLENFHASEAFRVLMDPKYNILTKWVVEDVRAFRVTFIKCILATDLAFSYEYTSKFQSAVAISKSFESANSQILLLQVILKVADVSHATKPWDIHRRWSDMITEEFFKQGDLERGQGLQISPLCDRAQGNLAKSQCDFIDFIVRPCVTMFSDFCETTLWTDTLNTNFKSWRRIQELSPGTPASGSVGNIGRVHSS